jgi:hypothetical protein
MKKLIASVIHFIKPSYFENLSFEELEKWEIEDVIDNKILFK